MATTPNFGFELIAPSQSQPEVPIDFNWNLLDTLLLAFEGVTIQQVGDSPAGDAFHVTDLQFVGATVVQESGGRALVTIPTVSVPLTTKGDLLGFDSAADRIPVGSNGQVLTADSTQALGVKWAAAGGAPVSTKGDLVGFDTAADRVPVGADGYVLTADSTQALGLKWAPSTGGGGSTAAPGLIPDLSMWWESDDILGAPGALINRLRERTPWLGGVAYAASSPFSNQGTTIDATGINGLPALNWNAASSSNFQSPYGFYLSSGATIFVVCRANTASASQAIVGSVSGGLSLYLTPGSGTQKMQLVQTALSVIGIATTAWVAGTAFQANVTYNATSGAYAFRQARAAAGSGSGTSHAGAALPQYLGYDYTAGTAQLSNTTLAAVIIYNRVLSPTEITTVENYLNAKWGV